MPRVVYMLQVCLRSLEASHSFGAFQYDAVLDWWHLTPVTSTIVVPEVIKRHSTIFKAVIAVLSSTSTIVA